jgi:hypothetical protein
LEKGKNLIHNVVGVAAAAADDDEVKTYIIIETAEETFCKEM